MNMENFFGFAAIALVLAMFAGWVMNLVSLFSASFDPITGQGVMRIIGVFVAPVGGVMGWL
ncbi:hypothetical protein DB2_58 [Octadecabacter Antarctic DB virus 2]|nr:hypothetical protein DB2_58 [Octadecabacter Antarctic DB virus 2]